MKKIYIKPSTKSLQLYAKYHLVAGSDPFGNEWNSRRGNDTTDWDDDEEEENTGGWFQ